MIIIRIELKLIFQDVSLGGLNVSSTGSLVTSMTDAVSYTTHFLSTTPSVPPTPVSSSVSQSKNRSTYIQYTETIHLTDTIIGPRTFLSTSPEPANKKPSNTAFYTSPIMTTPGIASNLPTR